MALFNESVKTWVDKYTRSKCHDVSSRIIALNALEDLIQDQRDLDRLETTLRKELKPILCDIVSLVWDVPKVTPPKPFAARGPITNVSVRYHQVTVETDKVSVKVNTKGKVQVTKVPKRDEPRIKTLSESIEGYACSSDVSPNLSRYESSMNESTIKGEVTRNSEEAVSAIPCRYESSENVSTTLERVTLTGEEGSNTMNPRLYVNSNSSSVLLPSIGNNDAVPPNTKPAPSAKLGETPFQRSERFRASSGVFVVNDVEWRKPWSFDLRNVEEFPVINKRGLLILNHSNCGATYAHLKVLHCVDSSRIIGGFDAKLKVIKALMARGYIVLTNNPKFGVHVNDDQRLCYMHKDWQTRMVRRDFPGKDNLAATCSYILEAKRYLELYPVIIRDMFISDWLTKSLIVSCLRE